MLLSSRARGAALAQRPGSMLLHRHQPTRLAALSPHSHKKSSLGTPAPAPARCPSSPPRAAAVEAPPAPPAAPPTAEAAAGPSARPENAESNAPINWLKQWYPVAAVDDLLADRPNAIKLLGEELVAWQDGAGAWRVAADFCPHRLAPMSEGRVEVREGGVKTLACAYHGWEFDGAGACVRIPQLGELGSPPPSDGSDPRPRPALAKRRSCLTSYPSAVDQGLLWVWADPSTPQAEADAAPRCSLEDFRGEGAEARLKAQSTTAGWFVRDLPASFEATIENVCDPAHVNFTHSGVQGNRKAEKGTRLQILDRPTPKGFAFFHDVKRPGLAPGAPLPRVTVRFTAPCLVRYDFPFVSRSMIVYVVPTAVGKSRMLARFLRLPPPGAAAAAAAGAAEGAAKNAAAAPSSFATTAVNGVAGGGAANATSDGGSSLPQEGGGSGSGSTSPASSGAAAPPQKTPLLRKLLFAVLGAVEAQPVLEHAFVRNAVLDGDNHLIACQERILAQRAERPEALAMMARAEAAGGASAGAPELKSWRRQYWMPGEFDRGVQAWRSWLQGPGRDLPTMPRCAADLGPVPSRREALDRYEQHTKICRHCSAALDRIDNRWLPGLAVAAAALLAGALWAAGVRAAAALAASAGGGWAGAVAAGVREPAALALLAGAVVAAVARKLVAKFREQLIFVDYVHADKN